MELSTTSERRFGHVPSNGLLLMAPQAGIANVPFLADRVAERMVELARRLEERGNTLLYLLPSADSHASERLLIVRTEVERCGQRFMLEVRVDDPTEEYHLRWPRDALQDFGEFQAITDARVVRRLANRLRLDRAIPSGLCEGGLLVRAGETVLVSSALPSKAWKELPGNFRLRRIPEPAYHVHYRELHGPMHCRKTHIDLDVALLRTPEDRLLLLVAALYRRIYARRIWELADELEATLFVVPDAEAVDRALNCVQLPRGDVLLPATCTSTLRFLEQHLGAEYLVSIEVDRYFNFNGGHGGFGCMTTILYPDSSSAEQKGRGAPAV